MAIDPKVFLGANAADNALWAEHSDLAVDMANAVEVMKREARRPLPTPEEWAALNQRILEASRRDRARRAAARDRWIATSPCPRAQQLRAYGEIPFEPQFVAGVVDGNIEVGDLVRFNGEGEARTVTSINNENGTVTVTVRQ